MDDSDNHAHEKLNDHIEKCHTKGGTKSQERREEEESLRNKYRMSIEELKREKQDDFDEDSGESYMKVEEGEYQCRVCGLVFATSLDALERHVDDHERGDYIKIARVKEGHKHAGCFVPEWHTQNKNGRFEAGSSANYELFDVPENTRMEEGYVYCYPS